MPERETVRLIYEHTKDAARHQFETMDALDSKATQMFAAAAVIVGFAAVGGIRQQAHFTLGLAVILLGVGAFLVAATLAAFTLHPYDTLRSDHGDTMWPTYKDYGAEDIQKKLAEEMPGIVAHNQAIIREKVGYVLWMAIALSTEATLVVIGVILNAVGGPPLP
jgi:hypothetical protein